LDSNKKDDKSHLILSCNTEKCNCKLTDDLIIKAFEFTTCNINYLKSLKRIFKFKEKIELIRSRIEEILKSKKYREKAVLISELNLCHEEFKIDLKEVKLKRDFLIINVNHGINWKFFQKKKRLSFH
jgi:hypothetical protein